MRKTVTLTMLEARELLAVADAAASYGDHYPAYGGKRQEDAYNRARAKIGHAFGHRWKYLGNNTESCPLCK